MSSGGPIIVNQNQNGCCAGSGCGGLLAILLVLSLIFAWWDAVKGEYGIGWQLGTISGTVLLVAILALGAFISLDERFGWGYFATSQDDAQEVYSRDAADIIIEDESTYNHAVDRQIESEPGRKLRRLKGLLDQGLISQQEFDAKREEIFKGL